jgi:hypothetical protein
MKEHIGQGEITRLTICCEWATQDGPRQRYFSLAQLRQYVSWERMNEVLDYLEAVCREAKLRVTGTNRLNAACGSSDDSELHVSSPVAS